MANKSDKGSDVSGKGEAGRKSTDARSDLFVSVEKRDSGGLHIRLKSKVGAFYGDSIKDMAERTAAAFHVEHALLEIDDRGALPFVIQARVEAALKGAGFDGDARPERTVPSLSPTEKTRLRRSRLYLPGNEPKFMINAGLHKPDGVILDLEDSVHADQKNAARLVVRNALRCVNF
ncbi:MAG: citrate lyase ACP, partial [Bacteroidetes bacterium]|nr:citrate lyase ACP [Bacteroidota bacterium]